MYFMVCWREDFKSYSEDEFSFDEDSSEEDLNRFKLMVGDTKEEVIQAFLTNQYELWFEQEKSHYYDAALMREFILSAIYGDPPLKGVANEASISELSDTLYDRYQELLKENNDTDEEKCADLLGKEFPPDRFLSLLSDAEKKEFFVSEMYYRVVAIKMKRLVTDLF